MFGLYILAGLFVAFIFHQFYWRRRNLPPGPTPWPLVGNAGLIAKGPFDIRECVAELDQQYGPIYTLWFGSRAFVLISDYHACLQLFVQQGEEFSDRTDNEEDHGRMIYVTGSGGGWGMTPASGPHWKEQRRFTLHVFRDFGVGRPVMERCIIDETRLFLSHLRKEAEKNKGVCDPYMPILRAIGNIINALTFGKRFDDNDKTVENLKHVGDDFYRMSSNPLMAALYFPWTRRFKTFSEVWKIYDNYIAGNFDFIKIQLAQHKAKFDPTAEPDDYASAYLKELHERKQKGDMGSFSDVQCVAALFDIWTGALESTVATMSWCMLYLVHYPEFQEKVAAEIHSVVGKERSVCMDDKTRLPFTNAFIQEVQRVANVQPFNMARLAKKDFTILGQNIKQGSRLIPNLSCIISNEKYFPNAKKFDPGHFLDENGKLKKIDQFRPFGMGKRMCLGEALARMELFLIISNMLQSFEISKVYGEPYPENIPVDRYQIFPKPFECTFKARV